MKIHCFEIEDAIKYGTEKAVLLYNLRYWLEKNKANNVHIHELKDGKKYYWTYNSSVAFELLFPYISSSSIRRHMRELEDKKIILSNNFNESKMNRTKWYTMPEFECENTIDSNNQSIGQNNQSIGQNDQSSIDIYNNNIYNNIADINTYIPPLDSLQSGGIVSENSGTEISGEKTKLKEKVLKFKQIPEREKRIEIIQKDVQLRTFYVEKIYKLYVSRILPGARLTKMSKEKILTRLKEYAPDELAKAIGNFSEDTWWMENNAYRGLKWFFHSEDRIEQFLKLPEMTNYSQKNNR